MSSRLIEELQRRYAISGGTGELRAVFLHGSAVSQRQDASSDLDLLVITGQTAPAFHALWHIDQTPCDLHVTSLPDLLSAVAKDHPSNNNFALRAFSTGIPLFQADPVIAGHQRAALTRWQAGPPAPSPANVYAIRQAGIQTGLFLEKCSVRATFDPVWREIGFARAGTFLGQLTDSYCRLNRLWSNAFWIVMHEKGPEYQPIATLIRQFLTPDPEAKLSTLRLLCDTIVALADDRTVPPSSSSALVG